MADVIRKELVAPSDTKHLARIRELIQESALAWSDDKGLAMKLTLAVDEAVANVVEHAYEGLDEVGEVKVLVEAAEDRFEVTVMDTGHEFDPSTIDVPDMKEHVRQGKRNGLGIFLMRQIMDEVKYTFVHGLRNELRMVKYKPAKEG